MILLALTGCLGRQAPAYTWAWNHHPPTAERPGPRQGEVLAVFAGDGGAAHPDGATTADPCTPWEQDAVAVSIREELAEGGSLYWLGDNTYPAQAKADDGEGCAAGSPWAASKAALTRQADAGYRTRAHFLPGNHDYHGPKRVRVELQAGLIRELEAVPLAYDSPVESVDLGPLVLVAYDTQYAVRIDPEATLAALDEAVAAAAAKGRRVVLAGHHGVYSVGQHGYHPWRGLFTPTDMAHPAYHRWRQMLLPKLDLWQAEHRIAVAVAAHDHNLQLLQVDQGLYVTTGSASESTPVRGAEGPKLEVFHAEASLGYAVLTADDAGRTWIELVSVRKEREEGCETVGSTGWFRCRVAAKRF